MFDLTNIQGLKSNLPSFMFYFKFIVIKLRAHSTAEHINVMCTVYILLQIHK